MFHANRTGDTKLVVAFRNVVNAPRSICVYVYAVSRNRPEWRKPGMSGSPRALRASGGE